MYPEKRSKLLIGAATGCPKSSEFDTHREPGPPSELSMPSVLEELLSLSDYENFSDGMGRGRSLQNLCHLPFPELQLLPLS